MLSSTDQQEHCLSQLTSIRHFFMSLFISTTGLVMSPRFLLQHLPVLAGGVLVCIICKTCLVSSGHKLFLLHTTCSLFLGCYLGYMCDKRDSIAPCYITRPHCPIIAAWSRPVVWLSWLAPLCMCDGNMQQYRHISLAVICCCSRAAHASLDLQISGRVCIAHCLPWLELDQHNEAYCHVPLSVI